jgi:hypothetical protein
MAVRQVDRTCPDPARNGVRRPAWPARSAHLTKRRNAAAANHGRCPASRAVTGAGKHRDRAGACPPERNAAPDRQRHCGERLRYALAP